MSGTDERRDHPGLSLTPGHAADCRCWECGRAWCEANFGGAIDYLARCDELEAGKT